MVTLSVVGENGLCQVSFYGGTKQDYVAVVFEAECVGMATGASSSIMIGTRCHHTYVDSICLVTASGRISNSALKNT